MLVLKPTQLSCPTLSAGAKPKSEGSDLTSTKICQLQLKSLVVKGLSEVGEKIAK